MITEGVRSKDVESLSAGGSWENITKLAIQYSDAIIVGSQTINPNISTYLEDVKKPIIGFEGSDTYIDAYSNLYDELIASKATSVPKK